MKYHKFVYMNVSNLIHIFTIFGQSLSNLSRSNNFEIEIDAYDDEKCEMYFMIYRTSKLHPHTHMIKINDC